MRHQDCSLCSLLSDKKNMLFEADHLSVVKSPYAHKWPGAIQIIFSRHIQEMEEIRSVTTQDTWYQLQLLQKAVKLGTQAQKINFFKLGNVVSHLHWHIIPRFQNERFPTKSPFEFSDKDSLEDIYQTPLAKSEFYHSNIADAYQKLNKEWKTSTFSCGLFLRPALPFDNHLFLQSPLSTLIDEARKHPNDWECLLMQRNYADHSWDMIGGQSDPLEFPLQTLQREVQEEVKLTLTESIEVCRQWNKGVIKGFVYAVKPDTTLLPWHLDQFSPDVDKKEVKDLRFFRLNELMNNTHLFKAKVRGRIQAFTAGLPDFQTEEDEV